MDFWPEFLATSSGKEFVAGGCGGIAGIISGYPLDSIRVKQQQGKGSGSAFNIFRQILATEGHRGLYRGMAAPLGSVTIQNAMVFQIYAALSREFDKNILPTDPPSLKGVALGGFGAGAIQSLILSPVELVKIRLQLQRTNETGSARGSMDMARSIVKREGWSGIYRGFTVTALRDAPAHAFYFWTYEYLREQLHPGCRKNGQETFKTMLIAGGLAGVASWICCYPVDVIKTRLQAQSDASPLRYNGIVDCFRRSVKQEGYNVLWRGLGTAVVRAFIVNGAVFTGYETALRFLFNSDVDPATIPNESAL